MSVSTAACALALAAASVNVKKTKKKTLDEKLVKDRKQKGSYYSIFKELKEDDPQSFVDYMRMKPNLFENLLNKLQPLIQKQNKMRV